MDERTLNISAGGVMQICKSCDTECWKETCVAQEFVSPRSMVEMLLMACSVVCRLPLKHK